MRAGPGLKVRLTGDGQGTAPLVQWAAQAFGGDGARATAGACALLEERVAVLQQQMYRSRAAAADAAAGEGAEARPSAARRADLLAVAEGALRAGAAGLAQLRCSHVE